jgi:GNAT superfamily N-acetyltransferase
MDRPDIAMLDEPTAAFRARLLEQLMIFSDPRAGARTWPAHDLCLAIRDTDGAIVGGLWGRFYYDWLFIALIFVPEDRRGEELGSALLAMAEAQARAWGGVGVWLDTFSFQARGFYEKRGFAVFGEIAEYPAPHKRFYLSKRLDPTGPRAASHPAIERIAEPGPHHRAAIDGPLSAFNDAAIGGGGWPDATLALALRDGDGQTIGGLWGHSYYHWLFIDLLVVPDHVRGQGIGTDLLGRAEAEARARGCIGVWLDTFSFQAPQFYPRHGYAAFGEIADYPAPHRRVFLSKRL